MTEQPAFEDVPLPLFTVYRITCGYAPTWCRHEVRDTDPDQATRMMGEHYDMSHYGKHKPIELQEVGQP